MSERPLYEGEGSDDGLDPDATPIRDRKVVTQPYDLVVGALMEQIGSGTLHLRPLSDRPSFQRRYVWTNPLASRLVESILLNVPIPPVYLSQNADFELDVIDGQQRIYSLYRFIENQFKLSGLEVLDELNGKRFFEIPSREQRKILTHVLRCVIITNDSHPEIKFDVFERLNTNTAPLNAQEIRNCVYRGRLVALLGELVEYEPWLAILRRKTPDRRMRDEEMILRFFAFQVKGLESYRTPQKHWLNDMAREGRGFDEEQVRKLADLWKSAIDKSLIVFTVDECFRRPGGTSRVINRALMDLVLDTVCRFDEKQIKEKRRILRDRVRKILEDEDFADLIARSVDHKSRTLKRFELWNDSVVSHLNA